MTSTLLCDKMDTESEYQFQCSRAGWAWGENRESGENPERYRHCKRGGLTPRAKAGHWMRSEKTGEGLGCASQDTC